MALNIDRVETEMEVLTPARESGVVPALNGPVLPDALLSILRPAVLQILTEELEKLERRYGG